MGEYTELEKDRIKKEFFKKYMISNTGDPILDCCLIGFFLAFIPLWGPFFLIGWLVIKIGTRDKNSP